MANLKGVNRVNKFGVSRYWHDVMLREGVKKRANGGEKV
jgi:hypothetical protein